VREVRFVCRYFLDRKVRVFYTNGTPTQQQTVYEQPHATRYIGTYILLK